MVLLRDLAAYMGERTLLGNAAKPNVISLEDRRLEDLCEHTYKIAHGITKHRKETKNSGCVAGICIFAKRLVYTRAYPRQCSHDLGDCFDLHLKQRRHSLRCTASRAYDDHIFVLEVDVTLPASGVDDFSLKGVFSRNAIWPGLRLHQNPDAANDNPGSEGFFGGCISELLLTRGEISHSRKQVRQLEFPFAVSFNIAELCDICVQLDLV